jgi:cytochrome c
VGASRRTLPLRCARPLCRRVAHGRVPGAPPQSRRQPGAGVWLSGLVALLIGLASYNRSSECTAAALTGGNPGRGKEVIRQYGCGSCHTIPGIRGAHAIGGPSLEWVASRMYIAGVLPNTPENMLRSLQNPPAVQPFTARPDMGVTETDARDIAGYPYTLR